LFGFASALLGGFFSGFGRV